MIVRFCFLLLGSVALFAGEFPEEISEESQICRLIEATKRSLLRLEEVKSALEAYRNQEKVCIANTRDNEALFSLSECAARLLHSIQKAHIEPYFRQAFLDELAKIGRVSEKKEIPPIAE